MKSDPDRGRPPITVIVVDLLENGVRVETFRQDSGPPGVVALHRGPELPEIDRVLIDEVRPVAGEDVEVPRVGAHDVPGRREDRAVRPGDGGVELFGRERHAHVDHAQRRPDVMGDGVCEVGSGHEGDGSRAAR